MKQRFYLLLLSLTVIVAMSSVSYAGGAPNDGKSPPGVESTISYSSVFFSVVNDVIVMPETPAGENVPADYVEAPSADMSLMAQEVVPAMVTHRYTYLKSFNTKYDNYQTPPAWGLRYSIFRSYGKESSGALIRKMNI